MILFLDEFPINEQLQIHGIDRTEPTWPDYTSWPKTPHPNFPSVEVYTDGLRWLYYIDETMNEELADALMSRGGAFYFDSTGNLQEDLDYEEEIPT